MATTIAPVPVGRPADGRGAAGSDPGAGGPSPVRPGRA
ncbi:sugar ABC transporter permease, partial [Clavibacter nebraskensis]